MARTGQPSSRDVEATVRAAIVGVGGLCPASVVAVGGPPGEQAVRDGKLGHAAGLDAECCGGAVYEGR